MRKAAVQFVHAGVFATGMVVFGLFAHAGDMWLLRISGLAMATLALAAGFSQAADPLAMLGLRPTQWRRLLCIPVCITGGIMLAMLYRFVQDKPLLAGSITPFAMLSAAIGLCEELAYRGFVQSKLRPAGAMMSCVLAAAAHTAYKCSLFALPGASQHANLPILAAGTLAVGIIFGLLRNWGGIWLPASAHISFDVASYGDLVSPPWWVI